MISAELATRVAQAYNGSAAPNLTEWEKLPPEWRCAFLAVAEAVDKAAYDAAREAHKADLLALLASVEEKIAGLK